MDEELSVLVGIDEGTETYEAWLMDSLGKRIGERSIQYEATAIALFLNHLTELAGGHPERVGIAIEKPHGVMVEAAVERGFAVFSINPKQLDRFRDRHSVAGAKDDSLDGFVLADSLRTDRHCFRQVRLDDALTIQLRAMSSAEEELGWEANRLTNRLRDQLHRFYPQALALCPAADEAWLWDLLRIAPTPQAGQRLRLEKVEALLRRNRIRRLTASQLLEKLQAPPLPVAPGVVEACCSRVALLLPRIHVVHQQRKKCQARIQRLLEQINGAETTESEKREHRDVEILDSFPGLGRSGVATMLAEASQPLRERNYHALRTHCGVAPVTKQSGKRRGRKAHVRMRYACNRRLRNATYHWARVSAQKDPSSCSYYSALRRRGHSHARALRSVANRNLRVLVSSLKTGTLYDPTHRTSLSLPPGGAP